MNLRQGRDVSPGWGIAFASIRNARHYQAGPDTPPTDTPPTGNDDNHP